MFRAIRLLGACCLLLIMATCVNAQSYNLAMFNANDGDAYYLAANQDFYYPFFVTDMGPQYGQSLKYSYTINNGAQVHGVAAIDHNHAANCINAVNLSRYRVALSTPLHFSTPGVYILKIWIDSINGQADASHGNDTLRRTFKVLNYVPVRKGLTEYAYHVSCGPCGESGDPFFKYTLSHYDDYTVAVKLHKYDGTGPWAYLNCPEAFAIDTTIGDIAHPDFTFNRTSLDPFINNDHYFPDGAFCPLDSNFLTRDINFNNKVPADLSVTGLHIDYSTRIVTFTVNAAFADALTFTHETRLSCMLAEDSIFYYQANNGSSNIDSIWHRYVLRKIYGGAWGQPLSIPASVTAGQVASLTFTDTLPAGYNISRLHLIPTLQYYGPGNTNREVLNVRRYRLTDLASPETITDIPVNSALYLSPNPAADKVAVAWKGHTQPARYTIYTADGRACLSAPAAPGNASLIIATNTLPAGLYIIRLWDAEGHSIAGRLMISR